MHAYCTARSGRHLLWMTAENFSFRYSSPAAVFADEKLGVAAIDPQHFKALVAGLVADFQQVHAALHRGRHEHASRIMKTRFRP
jgi:hypothetical protein